MEEGTWTGNPAILGPWLIHVTDLPQSCEPYITVWKKQQSFHGNPVLIQQSSSNLTRFRGNITGLMSWYFPSNFLVEALEIYLEVFLVYVGLFKSSAESFAKQKDEVNCSHKYWGLTPLVPAKALCLLSTVACYPAWMAMPSTVFYSALPALLSYTETCFSVLKYHHHIAVITGDESLSCRFIVPWESKLLINTTVSHFQYP